MVSKTLLFSFIASLTQVHVVVSEPSPSASLVHVRNLLSQHITDLSALLDNFKEKNNDQIILQAPLTDSSAVPLACNCHASPLDPACRIRCGNHENEPIPPADQASTLPDSNNVNGSSQSLPLPPAGLLPLRFSCSCTPPILISCKVLCANHGGTVWHPPNSDRLAASSNQARLFSQQNIPDAHQNPPQWEGCDCNNPTPECTNICSNHGGGRDNSTTGEHGSPTSQSHPGGPGPRLPPSDSDPVCTNPIVCGNHGGGAASGGGPSTKAASEQFVGNERLSDQHQQQNASMPLPGTEPFSNNNDNTAAAPRQLAISVSKADGSSATIAAAVDLTSYASFATSSIVTDLGFAGEIHPTHEQSITIHGQQSKVIGTVALLLADYGLHEVFYVADPIATNEDMVLPGLIVGVDFLQQIGGLSVKNNLLI